VRLRRTAKPYEKARCEIAFRGWLRELCAKLTCTYLCYLRTPPSGQLYENATMFTTRIVDPATLLFLIHANALTSGLSSHGTCLAWMVLRSDSNTPISIVGTGKCPGG
jgi:hypothetical protein